jgi:hypothetical protein
MKAAFSTQQSAFMKSDYDCRRFQLEEFRVRESLSSKADA